MNKFELNCIELKKKMIDGFAFIQYECRGKTHNTLFISLNVICVMQIRLRILPGTYMNALVSIVNLLSEQVLT